MKKNSSSARFAEVSKIYVAGHRGLVGSAVKRALEAENFTNLVTKTHQELDLKNSQAVKKFFAAEQPEYVFLCAAKVGGIHANNTCPADFIYENLQIEINVIHNAYLSGVKKLLFLGSSCIYPRECPQPIKEDYLLDGKLEPTNQPYAIAKIAGIEMCQAYNRQYGTNFIAAMPTNLYGPNDNFDLENSHVIPALIRKFAEAVIQKKNEVTIWGSGKPRREFLHVDDLANACVFLMNHYEKNEIINIGTGEDISIQELAMLIKKISGFKGKTVWNTEKPDGTPKKLLDVSRIHGLGWKHKISLREGLEKTYRWYFNNANNAKKI